MDYFLYHVFQRVLYRLEVHADVSQPPRRRHSMSSDSANFSATVSVNFSETKSATVSFSEKDDVSTKVLVGSLCSQRYVLVSCPLEIFEKLIYNLTVFASTVPNNC